MSHIVLVLAEVLIIIGLSRIVVQLFRFFNQPQVIGEIVSGIMLGPSLFGLIAPKWFAGIFPSETTPILNVLAQIGLLFFMFLIGLELNPNYIRKNIKAAIIISNVSVIVPYLLGITLAFWLYPLLSSPNVSFIAFAMFMGISLSITAFPVLARIIAENNLHNSLLGTLALICAAVDDVTAWCLLAMTIAVTKSHSIVGAFPTILYSVIYVLLMITVGRFLLGKFALLYQQKGKLTQSMLAILYGAVILSGLITEAIGIHLIFGAFLIGVVLPKKGNLVKEIAEKTEDFVLVFLLPIFFTYSGLRTQIGLLNNINAWLICIIVIIVAIIGKYAGTFVAARISGLSIRDSSALGCLMNTRGLTELIALNIGLSLGIISPLLFTILVIMALVTTFMSSPLLEWIYPKKLIRLEEVVPESISKVSEEPNYRILVPVSNPTSQKILLEMASAVAGNGFPPAIVYPLSLISIEQDYAYKSTPVEVDRLVHKRLLALEGLANEFNRTVPNQFAQPIVRVSNDLVKETTEIALIEKADLVILGWHRPTFSNTRLGGRVGQILSQTPVDVAIYVDNQISSNFKKLFVPYSGTVHDDLALEIALRFLVNDPTRYLTILHVTDADKLEHDFGHEFTKIIELLPSATRKRLEIQTVPSGDHEPLKMAINYSGSADLTLAGTSGEWGITRQTLGRYTDELAANCLSPLLITRCSVKVRSHLVSALEHSR